MKYGQGVGVVIAIFAAGILVMNYTVGFTADITLMAIQTALYFAAFFGIPPRFTGLRVSWLVFTVIHPIFLMVGMMAMPTAVPQETLQTTLINRCWLQFVLGGVLYYLFGKLPSTPPSAQG